jgi:formylglycine-generating enzyme required for sulfatase activity
MKTPAAIAAVGLALTAMFAARTATPPASLPGAGEPSTHPGMVSVRAGAFVMGSSEDEIEAIRAAYGGSVDLYRPEFPRRILSLPAFWIDRTEVTQRAYRAFVAATGHRAPGADAVWAAPYRWLNGEPPAHLLDHPVTLVSFDDARDFCRWRGMDLPTEEQWEKAARGTDGRTYPWGEGYEAWRVGGAQQRSDVALDRIERWTEWWRHTYRGRMRGRDVGTFPVGSFPGGASPWGALDMAGNVFEWVEAVFEAYPGSPYGHPDYGHGYRVVRGGDWYLDRIYQRAAARLRAPADHRVPTIGFRCACSQQGDRHAAGPG